MDVLYRFASDCPESKGRKHPLGSLDDYLVNHAAVKTRNFFS